MWKPAPTKYPLFEESPEFEARLVMSAAQYPYFYAQVGHAIDPGRLHDDAAAVVMRVVHELADDSGRSPSATCSRTLIENRLSCTEKWRRRLDPGRLQAVRAFLDRGEKLALPPLPGFTQSVAVMLRSFISDAFEQGAASRQPVEDDVDEPVPERPEPERDGPETHQETGLHAIQGLLGGTLELLAVTTPRPGEVSS